MRNIWSGFFWTLTQSVTIEQLQQRIAIEEDIKAYKELYDLFFDGLYRFSYSIVRSVETAEEIVSDVFIKVWQIRKRLSEVRDLKIYLYSTAKNFCLNHVQRHHHDIAVSIDEINVEPQVSMGMHEDLLISPDTHYRMRRAMDQLTPQCRLIFQLIKEERFLYKEVAAILHVSPVTVRHQFAVAISRIAEVLPSYRQTAIPNIRSFSAS